MKNFSDYFFGTLLIGITAVSWYYQVYFVTAFFGGISAILLTCFAYFKWYTPDHIIKLNSQKQTSKQNFLQTKYKEADTKKLTFMVSKAALAVVLLSTIFAFNHRAVWEIMPPPEPIIGEDIVVWNKKVKVIEKKIVKKKPKTKKVDNKPKDLRNIKINPIDVEEIFKDPKIDFIEPTIDAIIDISDDGGDYTTPPIDDEPDEAPIIIEETPIDFPDELPRFPYCEGVSEVKEEVKNCAIKELMSFFSKNIKYPAIAKENGIEGPVVLGFVVSKTGEIIDIEIKRDIGGGCGEEAMRVAKKMPNWIPGIQNGKNVAVRFNLPVKFKLE